MARSRLSSLLVKDRVVSARDIELALKRQIFYGGALDTALLEENALPEHSLVEYQARATGYRAASDSEFDTLDTRLASVFPKKIADDFQVVPLRLDGKVLTVVTHQILEDAKAQQLRAQFDLEIKFAVAPEYRVALLRDEIWDEESDARFLSLLDRRSSTASSPQIDTSPAPEIQGAHLWQNQRVAPFDPSPLSIAAAMKAIAEAKTCDSVFISLMRSMTFYVDFGGILSVQGAAIVGRLGLGPDGIDQSRITQMLLPLDVDSPFKRVVQSAAPYIGPLACTDKELNNMLAFLGRESPKSALLLPIVFNHTVTSIIVGHAGSKPLQISEVSELLPLAAHATQTLLRLSDGRGTSFPSLEAGR